MRKSRLDYLQHEEDMQDDDIEELSGSVDDFSKRLLGR